MTMGVHTNASCCSVTVFLRIKAPGAMQISECAYEKEENIVGNGENACYIMLTFSSILTIPSKVFFLELSSRDYAVTFPKQALVFTCLQ